MSITIDRAYQTLFRASLEGGGEGGLLISHSRSYFTRIAHPALLSLVWVMRISSTPDRKAKKILHPVLKLWRIPLPEEQSNLKSGQYISVFPSSASYFGQISDPENTLSDLICCPDLSRVSVQFSGVLRVIHKEISGNRECKISCWRKC